MIKFLKKYENKSFEDLVNGIIWQDLPFRLKAILSKVSSSFLKDAPEDGKQYGRQDGEWTEIVSGGSIESLSGDFVNNTDPSNPVLDKGYKSYVAILNQVNTDAPVPTEIINELGNITFSYITTGRYYLHADPSFPFITGKSFAVISNVNPNDIVSLFYAGANLYGIDVKRNGAFTNDALSNNSIEIRVYN